MDVLQAALQRRSIRRFTQTPVPKAALDAMANAARMAPTASNSQPLRFAVVSNQALCRQVFPLTAWAGRIPDGSAGPTEATQPTAYIAILVDKAIMQKDDTDAGAAAMSILLTAQSQGIASCWLGSIKREPILSLLGLDASRFALHSVIALGYAAMQSKAVPAKDGNIAYYLESPDVLCVPKRALQDIIHRYE